ncbi:hypothetical protein PFISCL1PPCAC_7083, partial [Pristionchus fissidentatus]
APSSVVRGTAVAVQWRVITYLLYESALHGISVLDSLLLLSILCQLVEEYADKIQQLTMALSADGRGAIGGDPIEEETLDAR